MILSQVNQLITDLSYKNWQFATRSISNHNKMLVYSLYKYLPIIIRVKYDIIINGKNEMNSSIKKIVLPHDLSFNFISFLLHFPKLFTNHNNYIW